MVIVGGKERSVPTKCWATVHLPNFLLGITCLCDSHPQRSEVREGDGGELELEPRTHTNAEVALYL